MYVLFIFKINIIATSKGYGVTRGKDIYFRKKGNNDLIIRRIEQRTCFYISGTEKHAHLIKVNKGTGTTGRVSLLCDIFTKHISVSNF